MGESPKQGESTNPPNKKSSVPGRCVQSQIAQLREQGSTWGLPEGSGGGRTWSQTTQPWVPPGPLVRTALSESKKSKPSLLHLKGGNKGSNPDQPVEGGDQQRENPGQPVTNETGGDPSDKDKGMNVQTDNNEVDEGEEEVGDDDEEEDVGDDDEEEGVENDEVGDDNGEDVGEGGETGEDNNVQAGETTLGGKRENALVNEGLSPREEQAPVAAPTEEMPPDVNNFSNSELEIESGLLELTGKGKERAPLPSQSDWQAAISDLSKTSDSKGSETDKSQTPPPSLNDQGGNSNEPVDEGEETAVESPINLSLAPLERITRNRPLPVPPSRRPARLRSSPRPPKTPQKGMTERACRDKNENIDNLLRSALGGFDSQDMIFELPLSEIRSATSLEYVTDQEEVPLHVSGVVIEHERNEDKVDERPPWNDHNNAISKLTAISSSMNPRATGSRHVSEMQINFRQQGGINNGLLGSTSVLLFKQRRREREREQRSERPAPSISRHGLESRRTDRNRSRGKDRRSERQYARDDELERGRGYQRRNPKPRSSSPSDGSRPSRGSRRSRGRHRSRERRR